MMKRTNKLIAVFVAMLMCVSVAVTTLGCGDKNNENTKTFTVTLPTGLTGGTVTADKTSVKAGENVVITATPDADYELDWIKINNATQEKTGNNKYEVKNVLTNITVTAAFKASEVPSLFTAFPDDRFISTTSNITYYVNESGDQTYRSDMPTVEDGAEITGITVTMKYGSSSWCNEYGASRNPGLVAEDYSGNGFESGVLTDVSNGIVMLPNAGGAPNGYLYEIAYTATKGGRTETRVQSVIVDNAMDLAADTFGPTFENLQEGDVVNMQVVDAPFPVFGENKVLSLTCTSEFEEQSGFFNKEGIFFGTKADSRFSILMYNDSDTEIIFAVKGGSNVADLKVPAHTYMIWNNFDLPYYHTGGAAGAIFDPLFYLDKDSGEMHALQFTVVPQTKGAEAHVYIGALRGTAEAYTEFATFPQDRIVSPSAWNGEKSITYYVNESGTEDWRSDFPTAKNNDTVITAKAEVRYLREKGVVHDNFGWVPTTLVVDDPAFDEGILEDISDGITMREGFAYYIKYTATMADKSTETRTQAILCWDMAERIPDVFTGCTFNSVNSISSVTVEDSVSPILGNKMMKINFDAFDNDDRLGQVRWTKAGVKVAGEKTTQRLEFLIYNPNDFVINMSNVIGTVNTVALYRPIEPHTYVLWDPYNSTWNNGEYPAKLWDHGFITEENELDTIAFYLRSIAQNTAGGQAGSLYIGEFMADLPAAEPNE